MIYFHPKDTQEIIIPDKIENFVLRYNLFLNCDGKGRFKVNEQGLGNNFTLSGVSRDSQKILESLTERQKAQINYLKSVYKVREEKAAVDWRMIIGLGGGHVQETDMTLHHIYGIPYIPGSSIKGVIRHWVTQEYFQKDEKRAEQDPQFKKIFGTQENQGSVIFMDAYPIGDVHFAMDIMNVHYPDYYNGKAYPTDCQNPNPVNFLTIEKTEFIFIFLSKKEENLHKTLEWLKEAFKYQGFGAKTAVGYGYFINNEQ